MKAIVESTLNIHTTEFQMILNEIIDSENNAELRTNMAFLKKSLMGFNWFKIEFGSTYMTVSDKDTDEKIIFVEF
jgi:hypothetical protein